MKAFLCGAVVSAIAFPALAQDSEDWDYAEDPSRGLAVAAVTFDHIGIAHRQLGTKAAVAVQDLS